MLSKGLHVNEYYQVVNYMHFSYKHQLCLFQTSNLEESVNTNVISIMWHIKCKKVVSRILYEQRVKAMLNGRHFCLSSEISVFSLIAVIAV